MFSLSKQVIARLTPENYKAKRAYNDVATRIVESPTDISELSHAAQFMVIRPYIPKHTDAQIVADSRKEADDAGIEADAGETEAETETEAEAEEPSMPAPSQLSYEGHYELRFGTPPSIPALGWFMGIGRWDAKSAKPNGGVDLQLAPPGAKYEVAGRHARLFFDKTGSLIIRVVSDRSPVVVLGNDEFTCGQRVITESRIRISFGRLSYLFEFDTSDEEEYQRSLRKFFRNQLGFQPPAPDLSATPSPWDTKLGDWLVRGTVGKGAFATVSAAKHTVTGIGGAAKFFVRTRESYPAIAEEIRLLKSLPVHPQILRLWDVQYERQDPWFTGPTDEEDERYQFRARPERVVIIYTPFARTTFAEFLPPQPVRLAAFEQVLQGIQALHTEGFIHRDIKPSNLGVVSSSPEQIHVVLLDYGNSVRAPTCDPKPGSVGTIPFLAPEMESTRYDQSVDIWACGIFGLGLFVTKGILKWQNVVHARDEYDSTLANLQEKSSASVENLLGQMLSWDSARISAELALKHICFSRLPRTDLHHAYQPGQKRGRSRSDLS